MKEQEAIERCNRLINGMSVNNSTCDAFRDDEKGYPTFAKMKEFAEECKSALEKQIPKKLKKADIGYTMYGCPNCDYTDSLWSLKKRDKHCPNCGQALDWGNEDAE